MRASPDRTILMPSEPAGRGWHQRVSDTARFQTQTAALKDRRFFSAIGCRWRIAVRPLVAAQAFSNGRGA